MESSAAFVLTSSIRRALLTELSTGAAETDALLAGVDASDSAVYDALSTLRDRGVLIEHDGRWTLTASGQLIADTVEDWQSMEAFLEGDPEYWKRHRMGVIPAPFRRRLPEISAYDIVRDEPGDPNRHEEVVISAMASAHHCLITTPFYSWRHQQAVPDHPKTRMLVTREATDVSMQRLKDGEREPITPQLHETRLTTCRFASVVTDEALFFGLPRTDTYSQSDSGEAAGLAGTTATFVSETEAAVKWGRELFEWLWDQSDLMEPYIAREHPEVY